MRSDLPQGRVALLLSDIEGSTRMLQQLGAEGYARAQSEHRDLLRAAFGAEGGIEVDTQGDAFFFAFPDTPGCFKAAVAGTRALANHDWFHDDTVKVRIGVHCGEAQPTEEGYVGVTVNKAARIASLGHGGQILLSAEVTAELQSWWSAGNDDEFALRDLGQHRLKDFDDTQQLYQVIVPELPADFPALRSVLSHPNNLPNPLTPFIGRSELVTHVRELFAEPSIRVVTLVGPGGTGKTRLSIRVASEMLYQHEAGAFFVQLASIVDPALVIQEISKVLGIKEAPGVPLLDSICEELTDKDMLLVLDNFEQVQGAAREVANLLARCPRLSVLTTSRQPLRVSGERVFRVPPLALPRSGSDLPLDEIAQYEGIRLFVDRARAAQPGFELTEENVSDVLEICRKVDALPFAMELAAARLQTFSIEKLRRALDRRLKVLTGGTAEMLDHQQTLRDLIGWSYDMLSEEERGLWEQFAVFQGGCSFAAAEAVCNADDEYFLEVDVDELVGKSLLNVEFTSGSGVEKIVNGEEADQRIVMLETLREFALEKLKESGRLSELAHRHAAWFADLSERAAPRLRGPEIKRWMTELDREYGNIRSALEHSLSSPDNKETGRRLTGTLWFYWYERGLFSEADSWLERAVEAPETESPNLARSLLGMANLERVQNRLDSARTHCMSALVIFESLGNTEGAAETRCQLGIIELYSGSLDAAATELTRGVEQLRTLEMRGRLAFSLIALGSLQQLQGNLVMAAERYQESLDIARELKDPNDIATALLNLGEVTQLRGDDAGATALVRESLEIYQELNLRNAVAYALELLAGLHLNQGHTDNAVTLFGAAAKLREVLNSPIESFNRERYEEDLKRAAEELGESAYREHWTAGFECSIGEIVAGELSDRRTEDTSQRA